MITAYLVRTLPLGQVLTVANETHDGVPIQVTVVRELARRAIAEIAARNARIVELENQITQLKGDRDGD